MSSYKDYTTKETKMSQQKKQKDENLKDKQKNKPNQKNKRHQCGTNTLDVRTWTKDKIEIELLLGKNPWSSIVSRTSN